MMITLNKRRGVLCLDIVCGPKLKEEGRKSWKFKPRLKPKEDITVFSCLCSKTWQSFWPYKRMRMAQFAARRASPYYNSMCGSRGSLLARYRCHFHLKKSFCSFFLFFLVLLFLPSFFGGLVKEGKRWGFVVKLPFIFYPFGMFYYFLMQMGTFYFIGVGNHHRPSFLFQKYTNVTEFWQLLENRIWKKVFENFPSTVM